MQSESITPRQRILAALHKEKSDYVPFAPHVHNVPRGTVERGLRNRGMCMVKGFYQFQSHMPNVAIRETHDMGKDGREIIRTVYSTPVGDVSMVMESAGYTSWFTEHLFKRPEDYKPLLFMIRDSVIEPDYAMAMKASATWGEDYFIRGELPYEPMQEIIYKMMDTITFSYEWMDRQDEVLTLYDAMCDKNRRILKASEGSPMTVFNYGGNYCPNLFGVDFFRKYYLPAYQEATESLHKSGKMVGCHFDSDNTLIMEDIAATDLDFIEAYDAGMGPSVKAARDSWPDKVLWLNYPSAWHLLQPDVIRQKTYDMLMEVFPAEGIIVGITEDVPEQCWQQSYTAIMDGIERFESAKS